MLATLRLPIDENKLRDFCQKWMISELAVFGSVLRDDFGPESDVDFLVSFEAKSRWTLFDHVRMEDELAEIVGRKVDFVSRRAIETSPNPWRRREILSSAETLYVA